MIQEEYQRSLISIFERVVTDNERLGLFQGSITDWPSLIDHFRSYLLLLGQMEDLPQEWQNLREYLNQELTCNAELMSVLYGLATDTVVDLKIRNFVEEYHIVSAKILELTDQCPFIPSTIHVLLQSHIRLHYEFFEALARPFPDMQFDQAHLVSEMSGFKKLYQLAHEIQAKITQEHHVVFSTAIVVTNTKILPQHNKELYMYEEYLLKALIKLDGIDIEGNQYLRLFRKDIVNMCQYRLDQLDALKKFYME
jgi:hypothetical protein